MARQWYIFLLMVLLLSCENTGCERAFKEIEFLEDYLTADDEDAFLIIELEKSIDYLESLSGMQSSATGNLFGSFDVTKDDVNRWKKWLKKDCNC